MKTYRRIVIAILVAGFLLTVFWPQGVTDSGLAAPLNADDRRADIADDRTPVGPGASGDGSQLGAEIEISALDTNEYLPAVAYNWKQREYLVVWHTTWTIGTRDIRARRISEAGQLLGEFTVYAHPTKDSAQPSVAYDPVNDRYLVVWIFDVWGNGSDWDIYGRFIPWNGPVSSLSEFNIISWPTSQWNPQVAYARAQEEYFVVWANTYAAGTPPAYISGKRIYANGSGFPSTGSDLTLSHASENYINPAVTYNLARNEFLVVWEKLSTSRDIWAVRLTGSAHILGGGMFDIAGWPDSEERPAVAACREADKYLVVWQSDVGTGGANYDLYGRFVDGNGSLEGGPILIDNTTSPEKEADVACDMAGRQFLVVYQQRYTNVKYGITGRRVFSDHSMEPAFAIVPPGSATDRTNPAAAGGYTSYLITWEHQRDGTSFQDIHGRLFWPHVLYIPQVVRQ